MLDNGVILLLKTHAMMIINTEIDIPMNEK
jgi:hypothetical protein